MKSKHRHELETNGLSHQLAEAINKAKPFLPHLGIACGLIFLIWMVSTFLSSQNRATQEAAWSQFNQVTQATTPDWEKLNDVAKQNQGTTMQPWAQITFADTELGVASRSYFVDREQATQKMDLAENLYQQILRDAPTVELVSRANYGMGQVYELKGNLDKAQDYYKLVTGCFQKRAESRIQAITAGSATEDWAWLVHAKRTIRATPTDLPPTGQKPEYSIDTMQLPAESSLSSESLIPEIEIPEDSSNRYQETEEKETPASESTTAEKTEAEATEADATEAEATEADTTEAETTEADTTEADTTEADTTEADTTEADTTEADTTEADTTEADATEAEATEADTTEADTTEADTTEAKTTTDTDEK